MLAIASRCPTASNGGRQWSPSKLLFFGEPCAKVRRANPPSALADRLVVRRSLFARVRSSSGDRAHTWKAPRGDRRGGPVRAAAILMAAYPFAVLAHDGLILRKAEKLPPPRQCRQYLEQRPEHKREQPDPPEYGVDVVELLHLDFEARRSPGHVLLPVATRKGISNKNRRTIPARFRSKPKIFKPCSCLLLHLRPRARVESPRRPNGGFDSPWSGRRCGTTPRAR